VAEPSEVQELVKQLMAGAGPEEPPLLPIRTEIRGFRVRLDLHGATPPVWRRLELPGDLSLPRLHDVI
jgi:hypothetical protein